MFSPQVRLLSKWQLKMVFPFRILGAKVLPRLNGILVSLLQKCQRKNTNHESSWADRVFQWNKLALVYASHYLEFSMETATGHSADDITHCHKVVYPSLLAQTGVWPYTSRHFRKMFCFYSPVNPQHSLLKSYRGITSDTAHSSN